MRSRKIRSVNGQHIGRRIVFQPEFELRKIASEIGPGKIRLTLPNSGGDLNRRRPARSEQSVPMRVDLLLDDCLLGNPGEQNFVKRPDFQRRESHSRIERPVARQIKKIVSSPIGIPTSLAEGRSSEKRFQPLEQGNVPIPLRVSRFPPPESAFPAPGDQRAGNRKTSRQHPRGFHRNRTAASPVDQIYRIVPDLQDILRIFPPRR